MQMIRRTLAAASWFLMLLAGPVLAGQAPTPKGTEPAPASTPPRLSPALWKVADADTTIYLFGTIHALPRGLDWMNGAVASALDSSGELVMEIHDPSGTMSGKAVMDRAMLKGETLRSLMDDADRAAYEALLARLGMPAAALDPVEPWMAALTLATMPYIKAGYDPAEGVEKSLEKHVAGRGVAISGLETIDYQLGLFDTLPREIQLHYLAETVRDYDKALTTIEGMVREWGEGDPAGLAGLLNESIDEPELAETLLYQRNRAWAVWIRQRLARPGTVFVAVGAGHLAGAGSVQDALRSHGLTAARVQ